MRKNRGNGGFTMAELLVVVAIIGILSAVSFIALTEHQKNLEMAERDSIAKELYFAAQNHLTMAESEGYLGLAETAFGTPVNDAATSDSEVGEVKGVYYVAVNGSSSFDDNGILGLMLPFGSIEETVRGGSYLIRYQKEPAQVLDVFYWKESDSKEYSALMGMKDDAAARKNAKVGWYGGADAVATGVLLEAPMLEVENGDRLIVRVTDPNYGKTFTASNGANLNIGVALELIVSGEEQSGGTVAKCVILLSDSSVTGFTPNARVTSKDGVYTVVLDDITTDKAGSDGMHFAELNDYSNNSDNKIWFMTGIASGLATVFRPGEDITVEAVAFSNSSLANIAYSGGQVTNSLFAGVDTGAETLNSDGVIVKGSSEDPTALIGSFRHLENLDASVSGLQYSDLNIHNARQTEDLVWNGAEEDAESFVAKLKAAKKEEGGTDVDAIQVHKLDGSTPAGKDCYLPINPDYILAYDGAYTEGEEDAAVKKCHSITGVQVGTSTAYSGNAGLFGAPTAALTVTNLELVDFEIKATKDAGALAGNLKNGTVQNVVVYNSADFETANGTAATIASTGTGSDGGNAGGLVGTMTSARIERCAAAVYVSSSGGNAGGLVGTVETGTGSVKHSYSGGHVKDMTAATGLLEYDDAHPNVVAAGKAGGLIGEANSAAIENCYSTCSVKGATAGGLVGYASSTIKDSYATGRVLGASESAQIGAFAGTLNNYAPQNCYYFEIVNPIDTDGVITYMGPVSSKTAEGYAAVQLAPLDDTAATYNTFVGEGSAAAHPYSTALESYTTYPLRPIAAKDTDVKAEATADAPADFVASHYGDWPMPEILVVNQ